MPHNAMAALFGAAFLYAIVALIMGVRAFWRDIGEPVGMKTDAGALFQAIRDAGELRYLDGGGVGCFNEDDRPTDRRKLYHHLTFYGSRCQLRRDLRLRPRRSLLLAREGVIGGGLAGRRGYARRHRLLIGPIGSLTERLEALSVLVDQDVMAWILLLHRHAVLTKPDRHGAAAA